MAYIAKEYKRFNAFCSTYPIYNDGVPDFLHTTYFHRSHRCYTGTLDGSEPSSSGASKVKTENLSSRVS